MNRIQCSKALKFFMASSRHNVKSLAAELGDADKHSKIYYWTRGATMPKLSEFPRVCDALGTDPTNFIKYALTQ